MTARPVLAVIDHGAGNLVSIGQGLERTGADVRIVDRPENLDQASGLVLPGVGAPGAAMERLTERGLVEPLRTWDKPLLGICVGLQLMFEASDEDGATCLGFEEGRVRRLEDTPRLPHIGWNDLSFPGTSQHRDRLFDGIAAEAVYYFVHSYAPVPDDPSTSIAYAAYPRQFTAAVRRGLRVGVQFHPERSGMDGLRLLANFVGEVERHASVRSRRDAP